LSAKSSLTQALAPALIALTCLMHWALPATNASETPPQSQCVACHSNLKSLIRLCWEVEKKRPKTGTSAETAGEG